ncbi:TM2 domain-containing protein [Tenacibaculum ovolyticum]|uniref:TM2 domain-containing protein n=1 Tax=Tenacibaculum ovolyticum TaxID=104270 RepID=UPI000429C044|nr:TM2 domain-containing protein [Tenacibaculum ovolyticum]
MNVIDENGTPVPNQESKRVLAGVLGILIGALGIHKFMLGYTKEGVIMLLVTILTCGFGGMVTGIIGLVEGIIYLTKSDEEFIDTYQVNQKGWF